MMIAFVLREIESVYIPLFLREIRSTKLILFFSTLQLSLIYFFQTTRSTRLHKHILWRPSVIKKNLIFLCFVSCVALLLYSSVVMAAEKDGFADLDLKAKETALSCRDEVIQEFQTLLAAKRLTVAQLFDTFYIPIANTAPQKFTTQYDKITDQILKVILDKYLAKDSRLTYVVAVDKNGYAPAHNSKYSLPPTSDLDYNMKYSRDKRLFNDKTGLAAAKNTKPLLLQTYSRDTGEELLDLSVPIFINDKHWGAIRVAYKK